MKINALKLELPNEISENIKKEEEEFNIPIDLSDIISVCKEYNKLGLRIQYQVENLLERGIEDSIKSGIVKVESLPIIKDFLNSICDNVYFGDAAYQADECVALIEHFEMRNPELFKSYKN